MKIVLTGRPGSGKSTLIRKLVEEFKGRKIAGILTPQILERNQRVGFEIVDLGSGKKEVMASVRYKGSPRVSKYGVSVERIDAIVDRFLEHLPEAELVFIDEIGRMESFSRKFMDAVETVFDSEKSVVAVVGPTFLEKFKNRARVFMLDGNSDEVFLEIRKLLSMSLEN